MACHFRQFPISRNLDELLFQDPALLQCPTTPESRDSTTLLPPLLEHRSLLPIRPHADIYIKHWFYRRLNTVLRPCRNNRLLMRRTSVSLPTTRNVAYDSHEKPARYNPRVSSGRNSSTLAKIKAAWMTQSQRSRYLKTGGILLFVVFLFYFFSSRGGAVYNEGKYQFTCKWTVLIVLCSYQLRWPRWWPDSVRPVCRNRQVLEIKPQIEAHHPICPYD